MCTKAKEGPLSRLLATHHESAANRWHLSANCL